MIEWSDGNSLLTWTPDEPLATEDVWTIGFSATSAGQFGDSSGNLLDGDGDGLAGGDYVAAWSVGAAGPRVEVCKTLAQGRVVIDFSEQMLPSSLRNHVNLWVQDASGLEVQGRLVWSKGNLAAAPPPNSLGVIDLTARPEWLAELMLSGTRDTSALTMTAKGGSVGGAVIGSILCESDNGIVESLAKLDAAGISVRGDIVIEGSLGTLKVANVEAGRIDVARGLVAADIKTKTLTATMGRVADVRLDTHLLPIQSLTVTEWRKSTSSGGDTFEDAISAPGIRTLTATGVTANALTGVTALAGRFEADLALSGEGLAPTSKTLGSVSIAGNATGAWDVAGLVDSVTIKGDTDQWVLEVSDRTGFDRYGNSVPVVGSIGNLSLGTIGQAEVNASATIAKVTATRWLTGGLAASRVNSFSIAGKAATRTAPAISGDLGANLTLTGDGLLSGAKTLGSASVAGIATGSWTLAGLVGSVAVKGETDNWMLNIGDRSCLDSSGNSVTVQGNVSSLSLGLAGDITVASSGVIGSVTAIAWDSGSISAGAIGTLRVNGKAATTTTAAIPGDFGASLTLSGAGLSAPTKTLGSATVAGIAEAPWNIDGMVGTVKVGGELDGWALDVDGRSGTDRYGKVVPVPGSVSTLKLGVVDKAQVEISDVLSSITAIRWDDGSLTAGQISRVTISGKAATGTLQEIQGNFSADVTCDILGTVSIAGDASNAIWRVTDTVGAVTVKKAIDTLTVLSGGAQKSWSVANAVNSRIVAGVDPKADLAVGEVFQRSDFNNVLAKIGSFMVNGWRLPVGDATRFVMGLTLVAPQFGALSLKNAGDNACDIYAFDSAGTMPIDTYSYSDWLTGERWSVKLRRGEVAPVVGAIDLNPI